VLAGCGIVSVWRMRRDEQPGLGVFLCGYALTQIAVYSAIPYKTPWVVLGSLHPAILLAGLGAVALVRWLGRWRLGWAAVALMLAGLANLGMQTWRGSFRFAADERNPYVYSQTSPDVVRLVKNIREVAAQHPKGGALVIKVMSPEYWPLPWYLRAFPNVGYWSGPDLADDPEAPVMITQTEMADKLQSRLKGRYAQEMAGLRPGFMLTAFYRQDLWDAMVAARSGASRR
jgi:predicted membrane-bound mannosyltransferase